MLTNKNGLLFSLAFVALMAASSVNAQTSTSNSSSGSNSNSGSSSSATSGGGAATLNSTTNTRTGVTLDNRSYGGAIPSATNSYNRNDGDVTVRTAPQVYAPPVSGGNPCTLAVSGGVSVIGWGASAGGTFVDEDCARRQKIAMVHNAGYKAAGKELMCDDKATYIAFKTAGEPCAYRAQYETALPPAPPARPAPLVQVQPAPATMSIPAPMPKIYPRCNARQGITDNCISG